MSAREQEFLEYVQAGGLVETGPRDLVLTPNWKLHDHGNDPSGQAVTWMDALDVPLVNLLDASFFEQFGHHWNWINP